MKGKILIIEDVPEMSQLVAMYLQKEGLETCQAETAEMALEKLNDPENAPDLVILDLNLPGMDGFEFLNQFRKNHETPVLIVSARDADEDIITGLGYGADGFVTKPFSPRVLVARVRAMLRRLQENPASQAANENCLAFGPYILDYNSFTLKRVENGAKPERVALSAKEYAVLTCLAENAGKPLTPEQIYNLVWKTPYGDLSAVAVYIQRLRKKIEKDPAKPEYLQTVFGMGYKFTPEGNTEA